jgi:hypothetical protein
MDKDTVGQKASIAPMPVSTTASLDIGNPGSTVGRNIFSDE